jgi:hypothetical protein
MNEALIQAVIKCIRDDVLGTGVAAALGGRIYDRSQVPPEAAFPRCYVGPRRGSRYNRPTASEGPDRYIPFEILFATTTQRSPTAARDIGVWDLAIVPLVQQYIILPNLVSFFRIDDEETRPQADQRNTFLVGGGVYEAYVQEV